jgi:hypothetical protein
VSHEQRATSYELLAACIELRAKSCELQVMRYYKALGDTRYKTAPAPADDTTVQHMDRNVDIQCRPQSTQSAGPVRFLIFCSMSIFLLASIVAGRRPRCNSSAE